MSLSNIQAQLGNILAAMPLKLQKVSTDFLDETDPPFEGAVASSESGQFYIADFNSNGDLFWKAIRDTISIGESSGSEAVISYDLPIGFTSSTLSFGKNLVGDLVSVFCQLESPVGVDFNFYVTGVANIRSSEFDFYISDEIRSSGFKIHILAKAYANPDSDGDGVFDNQDAFPFDATETTDTDGDGVGDNSDVFPNDPGESVDTDGDGVGDNSDPDLDGDGIPNQMDADYSPSYNSSFSNVAFVSQDTGSGTNVLEVDDVSLFSLGDNLIIGEGTNSEEQVTVAGFGSLVFTTALKNYHPKGTSIRKVSDLGVIELPSEISYITDGVNITSISFNGMIFNAKHSLFEGGTFAESSDGVVDYPASVSAKGFDSEYETVGGSKLIFTFLRVNGVLEVSSFSADWSDVDGDGYGEHADDLPNDPTEHLDSDGDGVGDNADEFPSNPAESSDSDGDGVGDNADAFPDDPNISSNDALYSYVEGDGFYWPLYLGLTGVNPDASDFQTYVLNGKTYYMPNSVSNGVDGEDYGQGNLKNPPGSLGLTPSFYSDSIPVDTDGDRYPDISDALPNDPTEYLDSDGDGVGDNTDVFPNDATETVDSDEDGVGDNSDAFPNDASESADSDGDGVGDNTDFFPNNPDRNVEGIDIVIDYSYINGGAAIPHQHIINLDKTSEIKNRTHKFISGAIASATVINARITSPAWVRVGYSGTDLPLTLTNRKSEYAVYSWGQGYDISYDITIPGVDADGNWINPEQVIDTDRDGAVDSDDTFPSDPTESLDSDGDGVGDNADAFPGDATETVDTDGDGVGDNTDVFPNDATETVDTDGDGVGDNSDAFPQDAAKSEKENQSVTWSQGGMSEESAVELLASSGDYLLNATTNSGLPIVYEIISADYVDAEIVESAGQSYLRSMTGGVQLSFSIIGSKSYYPINLNTVVKHFKVKDDVSDYDSDGTPDIYDTFQTDPAEDQDSDSDSVGDNSDAFPNDPSETVDTDSDLVGDNKDDFPEDALRQYSFAEFKELSSELIFYAEDYINLKELTSEMIFTSETDRFDVQGFHGEIFLNDDLSQNVFKLPQLNSNIILNEATPNPRLTVPGVTAEIIFEDS